ncbi:DUF3304 domain-containing protein [Burkholderia multivorans]
MLHKLPREWQPDLRVTVRWLVDKKREDVRLVQGRECSN